MAKMFAKKNVFALVRSVLFSNLYLYFLQEWENFEAMLNNQSRLALFLALVALLALSAWGCKGDCYEVRYPMADDAKSGSISPILDSQMVANVLRLDSLAALRSPVVGKPAAETVVSSNSATSRGGVAPRSSSVSAAPRSSAVSKAADSLALTPAPVPVPVDSVLCGDVGEFEICDARDGKHYDFVVIGDQTWLKRNLAYEAEGSWCPNNREEDCKLYGRLYQWNAANSCPEGWRLPSMKDFSSLYSYISQKLAGREGVGTSLKIIMGWIDSGDKFPSGTNRFGFGAKPAGYRDVRGNYLSIGEEANFWTSHEILGENRASYWNLYYGNQDFIGSYVGLKSSAMSVRCIKN